MDTDSIDVAVMAPEKIKPGDNNANSIVIQIDYESTVFLFTGDAKYSPQDFPTNKTAVLKVSHHGSRHNTDITDITAIDPEFAVISVGKNNRYKHPDQETLDILSAAGAEILRTDIEGTIVFSTDGVNISVGKYPDIPR